MMAGLPSFAFNPNVDKQPNKMALALWYASEFGWHVLPLHFPKSSTVCSCKLGKDCENIGKHPRTEHGLHDATTDGATIRQWWQRWPDANIGIATGAKSNLIALDIDADKGGFESLTKLEQEYWPIPQTPETKTGSGGAHILFSHPEKKVRNSVENLGAGLDIRGDGGYIVAPGSLHRRMTLYEWKASPEDVEIAAVPSWLVGMIVREDKKKTFNNNLPRYEYAPTDEIEKVKKALLRLAPWRCNSYDDWLFVGMALYSLGQAGLALWDEWSRRSEKYHAGTCEHKWQSFGSLSDGYTIASIFYWAKQDDPSGSVYPKRQQVVSFVKQQWSSNGATTSIAGVNGNHADSGTVVLTDDNGVDSNSGRLRLLPPDFDILIYRAEDGGIADVWQDYFAHEWRYVSGWECWVKWTGTHWKKDECRELQMLIQNLLDEMNQIARKLISTATDEKQLKILKAYQEATKRTRNRLASIDTLLQNLRAIPVSSLDAENSLNLANGTLSLDTLDFYSHSRDDHLTYVLPYEYNQDAMCPRWNQFLTEVLVDENQVHEPDTAILYQELFGYSLTTDTKYEKMMWQAGEGGNGKSKSIAVLKGLLGPLAVEINFQTLGTAGNYDLATLPGRRVVFSTESEKGGKVVESLIRRIASGEQISARPIYGKPFEFSPVAKIWWSMNDKPTIRDTSNATWRRLILINFNRTFDDATKDPNLEEKLIAELPGILNWAVEGLRRVRINRGFTEAQAVKDAISEFRKESNPVALFLDEQTQEAPSPCTRSMVLYAIYTNWCNATGRSPLNETNFGRELKRLGIPKKHTAVGAQYALVVIKEDQERTVKPNDIDSIAF